MLTWMVTAAFASSVYPGAVEQELGMPCTPTCLLCHESLAGGSGTVVQEFGMAMRDRGLTGGSNTDALVAALGAMAADGVDSDGDGTIDIDELIAGDNPNPGGDAFCDTLTPTYGCSTAEGTSWLGAAIAAGLLRRRQRSPG